MNNFFVLNGIDHRERIKRWQKYFFSCNPIYRNQICRTRLCFYAPVAGPIWVRPDDVMVVIRARNALLQPIQFHRTKKRYCHRCIVLWLKLGLDLWRKLLQWILHTWPLWSETSCIRTGGEYSRKEVFMRNRPIVFPSRLCLWELTTEWPASASFILEKKELTAMPVFLIRSSSSLSCVQRSRCYWFWSYLYEVEEYRSKRARPFLYPRE